MPSQEQLQKAVRTIKEAFGGISTKDATESLTKLGEAIKGDPRTPLKIGLGFRNVCGIIEPVYSFTKYPSSVIFKVADEDVTILALLEYFRRENRKMFCILKYEEHDIDHALFRILELKYQPEIRMTRVHLGY